VEQRLAGEQILAHAGGRVGPFDRGHHQTLLTADLSTPHAAAARVQASTRACAPGRPEDRRFDHVERAEAAP